MNYDQYDGEIGTAKSYMVHYFKVLFQRSGMQWNEDNESELESMVDAIVAAAVEKTKLRRGEAARIGASTNE